jgi:transposase-like protein
MPNYSNYLEFEEFFADEENCIAALKELRWPHGFVCPNCQHDVGYALARHHLTQCTVCDRQTSVTAGTMFEKTHMPLVIWFRMIYEVAQDKGGASSTKLAKRFGIPQKTAWHMLHKIRTAMASRNQKIQLGGDIELDEAFFNREARKYQPAPRTETQVLVMVETEGDRAGEVFMQVIDAASRDNIRDIVNEHVVDEARHRFAADGWHAHWVLKSMGHDVDIEALPGKQSVEKLPWVHIMISLTRRFLVGTYHGVSPKSLQLYLDEFVFRMNRRFRENTIFESLLRACVFKLPTTYAELKL